MSLPVDPNESAPLLAFLANATAETVGGAVDKFKEAASEGMGKMASAAETISSKVDGVAGLSAEAPDGPKNEPRSQGQEQAIEKSMLPEKAQSAALEAVASLKEQVQPQEAVHVDAANLEASVAKSALMTGMNNEMARGQQSMSI